MNGKVDLNSREAQSAFKRVRITSAVITALMTILAAACFALAIWVAAEKAKLHLIDWSEIVFIILLIIIAVYLVAVSVIRFCVNAPYKRVMHRYVAQCFAENASVWVGPPQAEFELFLAGDKLNLVRIGGADVAQFDLEAIKNYPTVCAYTVKLVKKYIADFCFLYAEQTRLTEAVVHDKVNGKDRVQVIFSKEKPLPDRSGSYFIKSGLII